MQQGAPSQLAFCNTLASQASSRQKSLAAALRHPWCSRSCVKGLSFAPKPSKRVGFDGAALPDPDLLRGSKKAKA
jgi:hypothetical protein